MIRVGDMVCLDPVHATPCDALLIGLVCYVWVIENNVGEERHRTFYSVMWNNGVYGMFPDEYYHDNYRPLVFVQ